jgi:Helix-turn-helix domain
VKDAWALPLWLTVTQAAEYCGVDRAEMYYKMLRDLEVRRIGVRGGAMPFGRSIRVDRGSLLRLCGEPDPPSQQLPRWVTIKQAAEHYQVSPKLIRRLIAHEQLDARRIGGTKNLRIDRESLLQLGAFRSWAPS